MTTMLRINVRSATPLMDAFDQYFRDFCMRCSEMSDPEFVWNRMHLQEAFFAGSSVMRDATRIKHDPNNRDLGRTVELRARMLAVMSGEMDDYARWADDLRERMLF